MSDDVGLEQFPGSSAVPVGPNDPQQLIALVPRRTTGTIALVSIADPNDPDAAMNLIAEASEGQLRSLGEACREVADWLHEHT